MLTPEDVAHDLDALREDMRRRIWSLEADLNKALRELGSRIDEHSHDDDGTVV